MKIGFNFHTTDAHISGVEYYSLGLLNSLVRTNSKDKFVVFTNQPAIVKQYVSAGDNLSIETISTKTRFHRILWEHLQLPRILHTRKFDILHCPHYICPVFNARIPYVVTIHDTIARDHPRWCKTSNALYYNIFMKLAFKQASKIIAISKLTAENLARHFKATAHKLTIIHPGIDTIFSCALNPVIQQKMRIKYGLPNHFILFVGNIEPKKNIISLLEAYKQFQKKRMPHKLVLVGKRTWKSHDIFRYARHKFSSKDIILTGYVDRIDLPFIYKMAAVFVMVSYTEGFGFPALEAMTTGTPVVASTTGILGELSKDAIYSVNPDNPSQIAVAMYKVIKDHKLRHFLVQKGLEESSRFNWDETARKTLLLYRETINTYE